MIEFRSPAPYIFRARISREKRMSKLNVGVGEDFPLEDDAKRNESDHPCAHYWRARQARRERYREWRREHGPGPAALGAIVIVPAAVASVTAAILYPLATLGVAGGLGLAAAAYRRGRWRREEWARHWEEYRRWREAERAKASAKPEGEPPAPPKEGA
jgi:hypothetical protein